jgi:hypothetical protein
MVLLSYQPSVDISMCSAHFQRHSTVPPVEYWHWWEEQRMDFISVPQYISARDAQSRAFFVSGRQMIAANSFTGIMTMDRAFRIQI